MNMLFAAMMLMVQDGLSYEGPALDQLPPEPYAVYFDRAMTGYFVGIEDNGVGNDGALKSIKTDKCVSRITGPEQTDSGAFNGPERTWVIDWKTVKEVGRDVPYFFAVIDKDDKILAFLTGREEDGEAMRQADMLSSTNAFSAARLLHMACDPGARKRYEEMMKPPEEAK